MDAKNIGKKLREIRGNRSAQTVAKETGISVSAVFMYEAGERMPRDEVKIRLASYYGVSVGSLFFGE